MGEEGIQHRSVAIDTSLGFKEDTNVETDMAETRRTIQMRLQESFESLPETKVFSLEKSAKENPQSVIFVPQKDLNMFPILIQEAKAFARKFDSGDKLNRLRDHEFEHVQKAYELGVDIKGIGLFMFKHKGKPRFGGFVTSLEDQVISLRDQLRILLAPKSMTVEAMEDKLKSELLVIKAIFDSKTFEERDQVISDTLFVLSERYLPKKVHSFFYRQQKSS